MDGHQGESGQHRQGDHCHCSGQWVEIAPTKQGYGGVPEQLDRAHVTEDVSDAPDVTGLLLSPSSLFVFGLVVTCFWVLGFSLK